MSRKIILFLGLVLTAFATDTAYSPPVGGMTIPAAANTDAFISVALINNAKWVGPIGSVSGSDLTVSGSPAWTANIYVSSGYHYARMLSGAQKGHFFSVISNTVDTLSVDNAGLNLATINAGDVVEIAPYWTLGTVYPAGNAGTSFIASASPLSRQTELLFYDATATGINRSASAIYYYYNGAWRKAGAAATTVFDGTIVYPDTYFIQRNKAATTSLVYTGRVQPAAAGTILMAVVPTQNDNHVALAYPVDVTLNASGLAGSGAFATSPSPLSVTDQLLWFDPAGTGTNRSTGAIYYYYNGAWRKKGAASTIDFGTAVLSAGNGFIIRKATNGTTGSWIYNTGF